MPGLQAQRLLSATLVAGVAFGLTLLFANLSLFTFLELKGLDLLFTLRGPLPPPENIIIVAIDEPSMAQIGRQWPWPRSLHAQLIKQLNKTGARVIAFDILFAEPSEPAEDQALAEALRDAGNVVLVNTISVVNDPRFRHTLRVDPLPAFQENAAAVGSPLINLDADGVVRRAQLPQAVPSSFAQQTLERYVQAGPISRAVRKNRITNHLGPQRTLKTVSYYQALDHQHLLPPGIFTNKIVLVGWSLETSPTLAELSGDMFLTPFSWVSGKPVAGVEIQATIISNMLEDQFIDPPSRLGHWALLLSWALASSLLIVRLTPVIASIAIAALIGLSIIVIEVVFANMNLWLPMVSIILSLILIYGGHLLMRVLQTESEQRHLLEAMNRDLEIKVTERTQELSIAHQDLLDHHQQLEAAYQELAQTQQQLVHSEKMAALGLLVAGVAHELNNPISYVNSNLDFIEDYTERLARGTNVLKGSTDLSDDDNYREIPRFETTLKTLRELITSCKVGTERVKQIVLDLQTFSRTDDIDFVFADLHRGLDSTLNLLAKQYYNRITIHRDYGQLPQIECYPGQINQVFMNILQNAVQAIPDHGDIWIKTSFDNERINITIRDNGVGIHEAHLSQIFDPFFTTKKIGLGTGLGLSISYNIIKKHGGQIHATSVVPEGTEFTIQLPVTH